MDLERDVAAGIHRRKPHWPPSIGFALPSPNHLYKYDPGRHGYVARTAAAGKGGVLGENRPFLVILQSENDQATGQIFPVGTGAFNIVDLRAHWDKVAVPGGNGQKVSESKFYTHTPGNNPYLINYHVVPIGGATPPPELRATENRAFEANILENHRDYSFYTSEHNDGHEDQFCRNGNYNPDEIRPATGKEIWRQWRFVYTGNARVPFWIVRVPKEIIWGHGGLWSDNSSRSGGSSDYLPDGLCGNPNRGTML